MGQEAYQRLLQELLAKEQDKVGHGYITLQREGFGGHLSVSLQDEPAAPYQHTSVDFTPSANQGLNELMSSEDFQYPFILNPDTVGISASGSYLQETIDHIVPSWKDAGYQLQSARLDGQEGVKGLIALHNEMSGDGVVPMYVQLRPSLVTDRDTIEACCKDYGISVKYS